MIDKSQYMTDEENKLIKDDIRKQVSSLKESLSDKSNFKKKQHKVSVMKVGEKEDVDE